MVIFLILDTNVGRVVVVVVEMAAMLQAFIIAVDTGIDRNRAR